MRTIDKGRNMRIVLLAIAMTVPTLAFGQVTQTPEGARQFLLQVLPAGNVGIASQKEGYWNLVVKIVTTSNSDREYKSDGPDDKILTAAKKDDCSLYITTSFYELKWSSNSNADISYFTNSVGYLDIDFKKLAKAEPVGSVINLSGLAAPFRIRLPSDEMAVRVAFAMEFLRQSCDPTTSTGF